MDNTVMASVLTMSGLGIFFASILAWANKKLQVLEDPKLRQLEGLLGGTNCGACGFASCRVFAEEMLKGQIDRSCPLVSQENQKKITEILGRQLRPQVMRALAVLHCGAKEHQRLKRSEYFGPRTCQAANVVGANLACEYGCIGFGDCERVCPTGAITMDEGLAVVNIDKCIACGKCVSACPRSLFTIEEVSPEKGIAVVACSSRDPGRFVRKACSVGCIACRVCEKTGPEDIFKVEDNLSGVDYGKAKGYPDWGSACEKCPTKCIVLIK
jgi:Na+-translocating ferredoxin:NAD+ oxidoreductase RNF subunit RnfB